MPDRNRAIRDVDTVSNITVFLSGVAGGLTVTLFSFVVLGFGWARFELETLWGGLFIDALGPMTWWIGFVVHLLISGLIGFAYAIIFRSARRSGPLIGLDLGFYHWLIAGLVTGLIWEFHPLVPETIPSPGLYMLSWGLPSAVAYFVAHLLFGVVVGLVIDQAARIPKYPKPLVADS